MTDNRKFEQAQNECRGGMKMTERVRFRTFFEEEEEENRFPSNNKWVSQQRAVPGENDDDNSADDDWKVGAWRSATGVCKIARERRGEAAAERRKRGLSRDQSSFESLDLRAVEVLDRSMQALESSTSLTSCVSGMTTDYTHWVRVRGGWEVEKGEPEVVDRRRESDTSQSLHFCRSGELTRAATTKGCHRLENDIARVLKDLINCNMDYGVKVSTTVTETPEDTMDKMSVEHLNVLNVKENTCEEDQSSCYARGKLWNGPPRERAGYGGQEISSPASQDKFMKEADGDCRRASAEKTMDATSGTAGTLDKPNQTELTRSSGCKMLPPKGKRSGELRLPTRPKGEQLQIYMKINSAASQRRRKRLLKNNDPEQRKRIFPSKPPKWKGLSTALSVMRSMCHGAGEAGVVDAQARPLLIIAGKCVFRTTPPLDTPRLCTISHQRKCLVQNPSRADEESLPPQRSADNSSEETRTASSHNQPPRKPLLPLPTSFDGHLLTVPSHSTCRSTSPSIKPWPAVMTELDNWISQIVTEWLDKDDRLVTTANSSLRHSSVTIGSPILSSSIGGPFDKKLGVSVVPPVSNISEFPSRQSKSLPGALEEVAKPRSAPSKRPTELDARIGQAQTVHDLSQLLEPISQASMSSVLGSKVMGGIKISPMSIIQEFGQDDAVQEFQRQIQTLERENEDLKTSLCKEEHSDLFRRLKALDI